MFDIRNALILLFYNMSGTKGKAVVEVPTAQERRCRSRFRKLNKQIYKRTNILCDFDIHTSRMAGTSPSHEYILTS